jgi:hypothetical protein
MRTLFLSLGLSVLAYHIASACGHYDQAMGMAVGAFLVGLSIPFRGDR